MWSGRGLAVFAIITTVFVGRWLPIFAAIQSPPRINKQPPTDELLFQVAQTQSENNRPFVIECEADGEPVPTYSWIKNGKPFKYQTYDDRISQQEGRGTLVISSPKDEDIGQYQCFAKNEWGVATSNSVFVRKSELNSFKTQSLQMMSAKEGDTYKLTCEPPDGWPKPYVYWLIQRIEGPINTIENPRMTVDPEGNLWFSNVTKEDASEDSYYACAASAYFRNEYKIGNKVVLKVDSSGYSPEKNRHQPVKQYVTKRNEVALRGKTVTLHCIYGGTPLPQTTWYKNGNRLQSTDRVSHANFGKSLLIKHVTEDDEGDYTCVVNNGVGLEQSNAIDLKVLAAPYFEEEPESVIAAEDETAEFRCSASGNPVPQIIWIHNGRPITEAPSNPRRKVSANSIIIERLEKSDTGNYGCNATNSLGYVYKDVFVNVLAIAPEIIDPPKDEETVDGRTVNLTCKITGSPKPQIKWIRNDVELTGGRYTILPTGDLQISNVGFTDMGEYTCHAQNKIAQVNATGKLVVKQRTQIKPGSGPVDYEVKAGEQATFRCSAQKDESLELHVEWRRNGEPIDTEAEPRFIQSNDYSLTITKATELDSGTYTCVASTRLDSDSAEAGLIVQDRPNAPSLESLQCFAKTAKISWKPMGDNRAPILNYVIQYNTSFTPDTWDPAVESVPSSDTSYTVPMSPWANYTFRVVARNKVGNSLPSQHSTVCRTDPDVPYKNPDNVAAKGTEPTNLVISWTPMPKIEHNAPKFSYEVWWKRNIPGAKWESHVITNWQAAEYVVRNVPTYEEYIVKVVASNEKGQANVAAHEVTGFSGEDYPTEAPRNVSLIKVLSATQANISWIGIRQESVRGHFKGYKIQMWPEGSQNNRLKEVTVYENVSYAVIEKLTPNTNNLVRVFAFNGKYNSQPSETLSITTPEGVPDSVQSFDAIPLGSSAFYLIWKEPLEKNGILTGYNIYYQTVIGTDLGTTQERAPQVKDPNLTRAKLAGLQPATKYRIYIKATTKAGEGSPYMVEQRTRGSLTGSLIKPDFDYIHVNSDLFCSVRIIWLPCGRDMDPAYCSDKSLGTHFYVKYKLKGAPLYEKQVEINEDSLLVRGLKPNEVYEFVVGSVDGDTIAESDPKDIETYASGDNPLVQAKENVATAGWFVGMILAIAFLILVLIIVCLVKRNRGGKYAVHEREAANGRHDYPDEPAFHEYSQPLGGAPRTRDSMSSEKKPSPESDTDSMAEFTEGDAARFTEDGSFIGQYGQPSNIGRKNYDEPQSPSAIATYV